MRGQRHRLMKQNGCREDDGSICEKHDFKSDMEFPSADTGPVTVRCQHTPGREKNNGTKLKILYNDRIKNSYIVSLFHCPIFWCILHLLIAPVASAQSLHPVPQAGCAIASAGAAREINASRIS